MHCSEQEVLICQHVFEGGHPDVVVRQENESSSIAVCAGCFGVADNLAPVCPHDGIPNSKLWEQLPTHSGNGVFRFLDGRYAKEA